MKQAGWIVGVVVLLLVSSGTAWAQEGVHEHDGFALRLSTGIGYGTGWEEYQGLEIDFSGLASQGSIALGYAVIPDLIINVDLFGTALIDPEVSVGSMSGTGDGTLYGSGVGIGLTYYIMPINLYIAASGGIGIISAESNGKSSETDVGFAINFMVGKEWWVSENWGIGVAAQLIFVSAPEKDIEADVNMLSGGLLFTATYN